jgi:hypothetical protein
MKVVQPDSALIEARITNGGPKSVEEFVPGFCVQTVGAYSPRTFVYTVIPRSGRPFPADCGTPLAPRPPLWSANGWLRAAYTGAPACVARAPLASVYKPAPPNGIRETGDFPLLARRIPGRDAWIAWLWANGTSYFGNTMAPCMHLDPVVAACPAGKARSVFGRMIFCEGSWDQLYERACKERPALEGVFAP